MRVPSSSSAITSARRGRSGGQPLDSDVGDLGLLPSPAGDAELAFGMPFGLGIVPAVGRCARRVRKMISPTSANLAFDHQRYFGAEHRAVADETVVADQALVFAVALGSPRAQVG